MSADQFKAKWSAFTSIRNAFADVVSKKPFDYAYARRLIEELKDSVDDIQFMLNHDMIDEDQAKILSNERDELHVLIATVVEFS
jgi:hypothetical protein